MLAIASESIGRSQPIIEVARELSLTLSYFGTVETLDRLMGGRSRRFVVLGEEDINSDIVDTLVRGNRDAQFGLIVCVDRATLQASNRSRIAKKLEAYPIVEWVNAQHDADMLGAALRKCRRRMLKLEKSELERALEKGEFVLQYQPKVERGDDSEWVTQEVEALIRWRHPAHGLLGPLEFLPEAEAFELIGPISEFVLLECGSQLLRWEEQDLQLNGCINLASSQLSNAVLAHSYRRIVKQLGLPCSRFTFEVTERDVASSSAPHLMVLNEMRDLGFRISLDDFGAAMSSLGTFEQLPFDEIKIHASALKRARENPVALKVLAAVTGLAHNLGISVCAEGIEDQETYEFLKTIECDKMQGYLISEAVMPDIIHRVYKASSQTAVNVA